MKLINPEVRIENTSRCNAHCIICPREHMTRPKVDMPYDKFRYIVDQLYDLGAEYFSVFGYGEPLVDNNLPKKLAYVKERGDGWTFITTNAGLLTEQKAHLLLSTGLNCIRFSVHGLCETYNKVHKGLNWHTTIENINRFAFLNKTMYNGNTLIEVVVIPMHGETVGEITEFWNRREYRDTRYTIDELEIWKPHNWCYGRNYREKRHKNRKRTCGRPERGPLQILSNGAMVICCFDTDGLMVVGNAFDEPIETIIRGERFNRIRHKHQHGDMSGLICDSCDQLNIGDQPLLYSTTDPTLSEGKTSAIKFKL